jgi:hypothetical protein
VTRSHLTSLSFGLTLAGLAGVVPAEAGTSGTIVRPTLVLGVTTPIPTGVKVGPAGAEWALPGGARVSAEGGSELRVIGAPQHLDLGAKHKVPSYTVMLQSGLVHAHVPSDGSTAIVVSAPRKTSALVAAGEAIVVAGAEVAVANAQGITSIGVVGQPFHQVETGMVEVVGAPKRPLLHSPLMGDSPSVLFSFGKPVELGALAWSAVPAARSYRVELRDERSHRVVARTETDATSLPAGLAALEPGRYSVRLVAVDGVGFESATPVARPLSVVEIGLPPGGFIDAEGAVRCSAGSNVELGGVEGVEMSYGHEGAFVPAPPSLGLFRTQGSLLRFRVAGTLTARDLWLFPRTTRARIEFGPRAPKWPGTPLSIHVRLDDRDGEPDGMELKPLVTVGVDPVAVDFTRQGSLWQGVLPAQTGRGPWVVRVQVKDQHGIELGRDFVEIAARAGS